MEAKAGGQSQRSNPEAKASGLWIRLKVNDFGLRLRPTEAEARGQGRRLKPKAKTSGLW